MARASAISFWLTPQRLATFFWHLWWTFMPHSAQKPQFTMWSHWSHLWQKQYCLTNYIYHMLYFCWRENLQHFLPADVVMPCLLKTGSKSKRWEKVDKELLSLAARLPHTLSVYQQQRVCVGLLFISHGTVYFPPAAAAAVCFSPIVQHMQRICWTSQIGNVEIQQLLEDSCCAHALWAGNWISKFGVLQMSDVVVVVVVFFTDLENFAGFLSAKGLVEMWSLTCCFQSALRLLELKLPWAALVSVVCLNRISFNRRDTYNCSVVIISLKTSTALQQPEFIYNLLSFKCLCMFIFYSDYLQNILQCRKSQSYKLFLLTSLAQNHKSPASHPHIWAPAWRAPTAESHSVRRRWGFCSYTPWTCVACRSWSAPCGSGKQQVSEQVVRHLKKPWVETLPVSRQWGAGMCWNVRFSPVTSKDSWGGSETRARRWKRQTRREV